MKITRSALVDLANSLETLDRYKSQRDIKCVYALAKNRSLLKTEIAAIGEASRPYPDFLEYDEARVSLCERLCIRANDNPIIINREYQILPEKKEEFEKDLDALNEKYKEARDRRDTQLSEIKKFLDEEIEIELHNMHLSWLPKAVTDEEIKNSSRIIGTLLPILVEDCVN